MNRGWQDAWPAPAKLNLFLHVVGRRADGYHLLQSVFRLIDLADTLRFAPRADGAVRLAAPLAGVPESADLTVRAATLLRAEAGIEAGVTITVDKRIPLGGGLGGGSSDAATTLIALNELWGAGVPPERLAQLGLRLGADVPFFLFGRSAFAEGIGEVLTAVELPAAWYLVISPQVSVPTQEIFSDPGLTRDTKPVRIAVFFAGDGDSVQRGEGGDVPRGDGERWHNDLEPVVVKKFPAVGRALEWLRSAGVDGRMSGSGGCVFAAFGTEDAARAVAAGVPEGMRAFVVKGLDTHPLA